MQPFIAAMVKVRQVFYAAFLKSLLRTKSWLQTILKFWISPNVINGKNGDLVGKMVEEQREEFLEQVRDAFEREMRLEPLMAFSNGMMKQLQGSLVDHPMCMLPSYSHLLPTGDERGNYLALDVGGSTFRVALIELSGTSSDGKCKIVRTKSVKIDAGIRELTGLLFFDWMAQRIGIPFWARLRVKTCLLLHCRWDYRGHFQSSKTYFPLISRKSADPVM